MFSNINECAVSAFYSRLPNKFLFKQIIKSQSVLRKIIFLESLILAQDERWRRA